jgi:hypothetical protein
MRAIFSGFICVLSILFISSSYAQEGEKPFDRNLFYKAMASDKLKEIDGSLQYLENANFPGKQAYEGALMMRKAGIITVAKKKIGLFKAGHKKLEAEIKKDSMNAEFRFLRLMIQENAPGVLGYKGQIQSDNLFIRHSYKTLPKSVQDAVMEYSKKSKILKVQDS